MHKKIIIGAVIVILIAGGYYYRSLSDQPKEKEESKVIPQSEIISKQLANKYQAKIDWEEGIGYTIQIQDQLITDTPALFQGYVDDIFNRDQKKYIRFSSSYLHSLNYVLELECDQQTIDKILEHGTDDGLFDEYAIVAKIREVTKPVFALKGSALSEDEVEINIDSSNLFTAKGSCVDVAYIGK